MENLFPMKLLMFLSFHKKNEFPWEIGKESIFHSRHIPQHGILFPLELVFLFKNRKPNILYYLLPIARNETEENKFNLIIPIDLISHFSRICINLKLYSGI